MAVERAHQYVTTVTWTGNSGAGTADYRAYRRDSGRYSQEDLLVASPSGCHMLWYLHLCAVNGVVVVGCQDRATGVTAERPDGSGCFTSVVLAPRVEITPESNADRATALHADAHRMCSVASSVTFPVEHRPEVVVRNEG